MFHGMAAINIAFALLNAYLFEQLANPISFIVLCINLLVAGYVIQTISYLKKKKAKEFFRMLNYNEQTLDDYSYIPTVGITTITPGQVVWMKLGDSIVYIDKTKANP